MTKYSQCAYLQEYYGLTADGSKAKSSLRIGSSLTIVTDSRITNCKSYYITGDVSIFLLILTC